MIVNVGPSLILILMYFSPAFDTAGCTVLLNPLQEWLHADARVDFYQNGVKKQF